MKNIIKIILSMMILLTLNSCVTYYEYDNEKINITATTNIMANLAETIGGDRVKVYSLMKAGVDPHQYIARPHDYNALNKGDFLLVSGLHLEGKMASIFDDYKNKNIKEVLVVGNLIKDKSDLSLTSRLIKDLSFGENYDPHFWFDILLYKEAARYLTIALSNYEIESATYFNNNLNNYLEELNDLEKWVTNSIEVIPKNERYLISAHDAFEYFGREFGFKVYALQGLSTEDQVSPSDLREVVDIIINNNVKAIFPENSVPSETIKSVSEQVKARGKNVIIGDNLYSDSLGDMDFDNTYIKMYKQNVTNIVNAFTKGQ